MAKTTISASAMRDRLLARVQTPAKEYKFQEKITQLGLTESSLANLMKELGDDRHEEIILSSIQRMMSGEFYIPGEMRALLGLLDRTKWTKEGA